MKSRPSDGVTPARVVSLLGGNHSRLPLCSLCKNSSVAPRNRACEKVQDCYVNVPRVRNVLGGHAAHNSSLVFEEAEFGAEETGASISQGCIQKRDMQMGSAASGELQSAAVKAGITHRAARRCSAAPKRWHAHSPGVSQNRGKNDLGLGESARDKVSKHV